MGFVGVVKFAVKCFDILAWPLFALMYPLWASIRAIEADDSSLSECRKLVAYWVLFSLIFLFEQAFHKLLLWLPFWLYMKILITCWLVMPDFDGALYVYKHLVHPCLSLDIKALINKFNAWIDFSLKRGNFEDEVETFVKEKGREALEELVASKLKSWEPNAVQKDVKTVQITEQIKEEAASQQMKFVPHSPQIVNIKGPDVTQTENKKPETDLFSSEKVEAVGESSEIALPKQVQKEWTCAICQVTTQSETTLNSHLQGKRHKTASEKLKKKTQQSKTEGSISPEIKVQHLKENFSQKNNLEAEVKENGNEACEEPVSSEMKRREHNIEQNSLITVQVTEGEEVAVAKQQTSLSETSENNLAAEEIKEISGSVKEAGGESSEIQVSNKVQKEWTCNLCQVRCFDEITLNSHLQGRRHKAACERLKTAFKELKTAYEEFKNGSEEHKTKTQQSENKAYSASEIKSEQEEDNNATKSKRKRTRKKKMQSEEDSQSNCGSEFRENLWWCKICNVSCTSKGNMDTHLNARKHMARIQQLDGAHA